VKTQYEIITAHELLAELHEALAKSSSLELVRDHHEEMAERLRAEAQNWRTMKAETFETKTFCLRTSRP